MGPTWDERFAGEAYFYGTEPNEFLAAALPGLPRGRGLFLGEGEGRNAVHAARLGHEVLAVDASAVGRDKALRLARERGVTLTYLVGDVAAVPWDDRPFDFAALIFLHLPPAVRRAVHARVAAALRPGGTLILESFQKGQLGRRSGGPQSAELLYDLRELQADFAGLAWTLAEAREVTLDESAGHRGPALVNRLIGVRPAAAPPAATPPA
ncbi:MAG: class I SAM-dependent methyltransferase [Candidatus Krumholzibacteriia bacterium]